MISEQTELEIFTRLERGESLRTIAEATGVGRRTVCRLKQQGRPRFRHNAHGQFCPSPAVIRWHCAILQATWTLEEEERRRVAKPPKSWEIPIIDTGNTLADYIEFDLQQPLAGW